MENDRRFKSIIEVAKICGVSRRTIYTWMKDELLTIYRLPSGQVRLDIRELLKVERTNRNRESFLENLKKGRVQCTDAKQKQFRELMRRMLK